MLDSTGFGPAVIDTTTHDVSFPLRTGIACGRMAITPNGLLAYLVSDTVDSGEVYDLATRKIVKSFFEPPRHLDSNVVKVLGTVHAATKGQRIAALLNLSDTLRVFDLDGTELFRAHIPVTPFLAPQGPLPNITSKAARQAWAEHFTLLSDLFWTDDDDIVVQSVTGSGDHVVFSLVQMSTTGQRRWVLPRTPELLSIHDGRFFFHDPNSDLPNRLVVAVLKVNVASNP